MSETTETAATTVLQIPPGLSVITKITTLNGKSEERFVVTFGSPPRTVEVVDLDLGAQFDLAEITGGVDDSNKQWHNLAFIAASVRTIDGTPVNPGAPSKALLRHTLRELGVDGMKAAGLVISRYRGTAVPDAQAVQSADAQHRTTVGN